MFLTLGGSHAYGTNVETSDVDVRGVAFNRKSDLLGLTSFEQFEDRVTDTVIYSFRKMVELLLSSNPNTIEILGGRPESYLKYSPVVDKLIENQHLFLSKRAVGSFGGYANQQLRRLQNAVARDRATEELRERHILGSLNNAMEAIKSRYADFGDGLNIHMPEDAMEILMDLNVSNYPLRDFRALYSEISDIVRNYEKVGKRNQRVLAKGDKALNKHAMHLVRLYLMAFDILEQEKVITYRENDLPLLREIRDGKFMLEDGTYAPEFFELVDDMEKRFKIAAENSALPSTPDFNLVQDFVIYVNEESLKNR